MDDLYFMDEALKLAAEAAAEGEVPVGCVIVRGNEIVGRGRNRREKDKTALAHAEIEAISEACRNLGGWRLWECTLYVTLEPCAMCAGAILNARIRRVVYGASDAKFGAVRSVCSLFDMNFNHHPVVETGIREAEAAALMTEFFQNLRVELRSRPKWKPSNTQLARERPKAPSDEGAVAKGDSAPAGAFRSATARRAALSAEMRER